eukprot:scaffold67859_cov65-Phaeocystis_antarctica.AAC.3
MVRDRNDRYLRDSIGHQVFMDLWRRLSSQKHDNVTAIVRPKRTDVLTEPLDRIAPGEAHHNSRGSRPRQHERFAFPCLSTRSPMGQRRAIDPID